MENKVIYKIIVTNDLTPELFKHFIRHQAVTDCWRKKDGKWVVEKAPFIDDWSEKEIIYLCECLQNTKKTGGLVIGAFINSRLKGFASVESTAFGSSMQYRDLSCLHISEDMRGIGIGKRLFSLAADWAKESGGQKLYISSHSAVETQAFYKAMGCTEALEYNKKHTEDEPFDCQLELIL